MSIRLRSFLACGLFMGAGAAIAGTGTTSQGALVAGLAVPQVASPDVPRSAKAAATLQIDDGSAEQAIGDNGQFLWLNRFTPAPGDFPLEVRSVDVVFGVDGVAVGAPLEVFVYQDTDGDGDPGTGAQLIATATGTVQAADNATATSIVLDPAPVFEGPGDILVGAVYRAGSEGVADYPAALDQTASAGRSWAGSWAGGDVPANPTLPADEQWGLIDSFGFPGNWLVRASIETNIPDTRPPLLTVNAGLTVLEGATAAIDAAVLQSADPDTNDDLLLYVLSTGPDHGQIELTSNPGVAVASFTQAELNAGLVQYLHDGSETTADAFTFQVQDGSGNDLLGQSFAIAVTPVDDLPVLAANLGLTLAEGGLGVIDGNLLHATDAETAPAQLLYTVTAAPTHGQLELASAPGVAVASFSQAQLDAGSLQYVHDDSNTTTDSFTFDLEDSGGNAIAGQVFPITITAVADDALLVTPASLTLAEGASGSFTVALSTAPVGDVVLDLASADPSIAMVTPAQLTFTSMNWSLPQVVAVQTMDDSVAGDDRTTSISVAVNAASADPTYAALAATSVGITALDDDAAGIVFSPADGLVTTESGGSDSFTVALSSQPTANVVLVFSSSDPGESTPSPSELTFTPGDWNLPRTVTVTGVDDGSRDEDQAWTVLIAAFSSDPDYDGLAVGGPSGINQDDDEVAAIAQPAVIPAASLPVLLLLSLLLAAVGATAARQRP